MRQTQSAKTNDEDLKRRVTRASVKRLLGLAVPYWRTLAISGLLALIGAGFQLALPVMMREGVNQVQTRGEVALLDRYTLLFIALVVLGAAFGFVQFLLSALAGHRIVMDLRLRLLDHLQRLPVSYFDRVRSGDISTHLSNDVTQLQTTLTDDIARFPSTLILIVGLIATALWMNPQLTVVVVTMLALVMLFFVVTGRALRVINRKTLDAIAETMGGITEALANIRLVKAFARERHEHDRAKGRFLEAFGLAMKGAKYEALMVMVGTAGFTLMIVGVVWYAGRGLIQGTMATGDVAGFIFVLFFLMGPMGQLASLYTRLQRATGAADRLFAILDEQPEESDEAGAVPYPEGSGEVVFDSVTFSYVPEAPVLNGLNLVLPAGKVTAIVGPSGAGKTTLSSLLYRFYEPLAGEIRIDGVPIRKMRRSSLRERIGIVPQEPILFNGSLRENIRYGRLDASDEEVEQAAKDANVAEFVANLPDGYETKIGERGITLSGGQRQRVAIARALLKDPSLLVLDEATSALDTKSEALVKEALDRLMQGRTTMVIAHRLSTVQNADQIAVVVAGQIAQTGTHAELILRAGKYAELYDPMTG